MEIVTLGLDLAKSVFQAHGIDKLGKTVLVKRLHRKQMMPFFSKLPPCLIGIEACATAHHWARTLSTMGHEVRLMPPAYVKGYVKRGKSDALDAEAICEAVRRPTMRFVPIKTEEQQGILVVHRTRALLVRQRTMAANALRAHLAEFGLVANPGIAHLLALVDKALQMAPGCQPMHVARWRSWSGGSPSCPRRSMRSIGNSEPGTPRTRQAPGSPRSPVSG